MRVIILAVAMLALAACAATGPAAYGPADVNGFGYSEQKIEDDRYRISYQGSGGMPPSLVEDYALRRAAELTLEAGFDWFRVSGRDLSGEERGGVSVGTGFGTSSYGRRSSVGVGVGADLGRVGAQEFFTARMEVLMGSGAAPEDGEVYDARSVLESLTGPAPYQYREE
jgi:predicted small lipoprotein YifL